MRQKAIRAVLTATVVAGIVASFPGVSGAKSPHVLKEKASVSAQFQLRGSRGFRISLLATDTGAVDLTASGRTSERGFQSVFYFSVGNGHRPSFQADRLDVRIGRLGRFRGRFVPTRSETKDAFPGCKGNPTTIEHGFFVGSFDFRGERDYTVARAHRERGTVTRQPAGTCTPTGAWPWRESRREAKEQKARERNEFHLIAADEKAHVLFEVRRQEATNGEPPEPTFDASVNGRKVGNFYVGYLTTNFGFEEPPETTFRVPDLAEPLGEVTVAPPAPFSGSATFHLDDPKTASWTGDLAVEMPGLGKVPLTGEGIEAGACKGDSCTRTLPKDLQPVLEARANAIVAISAAKSKKVR